MSDYGIKIVKDGRDINSTNPEDFIFSSQYPTMCIKDKGSFTFTTNNTSTTASATYYHNFGYIPFFMCFTTSYLYEQDQVKYPYAEYLPLDIELQYVGVSTIFESLTATVDNEKITIEGYLYDNDTTDYIENVYIIDYLLFMEEITLTT